MPTAPHTKRCGGADAGRDERDGMRHQLTWRFPDPQAPTQSDMPRQRRKTRLGRSLPIGPCDFPRQSLAIATLAQYVKARIRPCGAHRARLELNARRTFRLGQANSPVSSSNGRDGPSPGIEDVWSDRLHWVRGFTIM